MTTYNILLANVDDNIDIDQIQKVSQMINDYGPATVVLAVFIIIFLVILSLIIKNMVSINKQMMKQQESLMQNLLDHQKENEETLKKSNIPVKEKNIVEVFIKIDDSIKDILKNVCKKIDADRLSVYVFHNGSYTSHGLPFFKTSCISEIIGKNCGITKKADIHNNMPLVIFASSIKQLYKDGSLVIQNIKDIKSKHSAIYSMLDEVQIKSASGVAIYDKDNNILGVIIAEYVDEQSEESIQSITKTLIDESSCLSPILEFSDYQSLK